MPDPGENEGVWRPKTVPTQPMRFGGASQWSQSGMSNRYQPPGYAGGSNAPSRFGNYLTGLAGKAGNWIGNTAAGLSRGMYNAGQSAVQAGRPVSNFFTGMTPQQRMETIKGAASSAWGFATRNAGNPNNIAARYGATPPGTAAPWSDLGKLRFGGAQQPAPNPNATELRYMQPYRYKPDQLPFLAEQAWANRLNAQAADYLSKPVAPMPFGSEPPAQPAPTGWGGGGWGGWGGGGGGYSSPLKEYYNQMVNWSINQPNRQG